MPCLAAGTISIAGMQAVKGSSTGGALNGRVRAEAFIMAAMPGIDRGERVAAASPLQLLAGLAIALLTCS
jgi:hypothetical protein